MPARTMPIDRLRNRIAMLWMVASAAILLLLVIQSLADTYEIPESRVSLETPARAPGNTLGGAPSNPAVGSSANSSDGTPRTSFTKDVWAWILPLLFPTLGLIVTTIVATRVPGGRPERVRCSFAYAALAFSVFYLLLIAITLLLQPFYATSPSDAVAKMQLSNLWLGPLQALVTSALAVAFVRGEKD